VLEIPHQRRGIEEVDGGKLQSSGGQDVHLLVYVALRA
jgi:hypothetical protein